MAQTRTGAMGLSKVLGKGQLVPFHNFNVSVRVKV